MNDNKEMLAKTIMGLRNLKPFVKGNVNKSIDKVVEKKDIDNIDFVDFALKHMNMFFNNKNQLQHKVIKNETVTYNTLLFWINNEIEDMLLVQLFEYDILKKPENEV